MLGKLTGQHESDSGLDLSARKSCFLVVGSELSGFGGDALENVIDERVMMLMPFLEIPVSGWTCVCK